MPVVENMDIPTYPIASWSDHAIHTRGSLSAYTRLKTDRKWLEVHGRNKWARIYTPESMWRQMAFFDRFLKNMPNEVDAWPKIRLEVREGIDVGQERPEANGHSRARNTPRSISTHRPVRCSPGWSMPRQCCPMTRPPATPSTFSHTFTTDTELTGHFKLRLWVEADGADDMDLFASIQMFDAAEELVNSYYITRFRFGHVAHGWLRVSRRELDGARSTPHQPVHLHLRDVPLKPGEIVPVEIEIWPLNTLFRAGKRLRVVVMGSDPFPPPDAPGVAITRHPETRNAGRHIIHTGGQFDSYVLLPVIPG